MPAPAFLLPAASRAATARRRAKRRELVLGCPWPAGVLQRDGVLPKQFRVIDRLGLEGLARDLHLSPLPRRLPLLLRSIPSPLFDCFLVESQPVPDPLWIRRLAAGRGEPLVAQGGQCETPEVRIGPQAKVRLRPEFGSRRPIGHGGFREVNLKPGSVQVVHLQEHPVELVAIEAGRVVRVRVDADPAFLQGNPELRSRRRTRQRFEVPRVHDLPVALAEGVDHGRERDFPPPVRPVVRRRERARRAFDLPEQQRLAAIDCSNPRFLVQGD